MPPASTIVAIAPAARQTKSAACAPTTRAVLGTGQISRVLHGHRVHILLGKPLLEQAIGHQGESVLDRWVRHLPEIGRENVVLRPGCSDRLERALPRDLAAVDRRKATLEDGAALRELALLVDR